MPVDTKQLDALVRRHVDGMTPIRGRRVHRLLLRAFAGFDHVLPARAEDGSALLLALGDDGRLAACGSDGRGPAAAVAACAAPTGATVTAFHDLLKDSLPVLRWEIWQPGLARHFGVVTIDAGDLAGFDPQRILAGIAASDTQSRSSR